MGESAGAFSSNTAPYYCNSGLRLRRDPQYAPLWKYRQLQLNTANRGLRLRRDPQYAPLWKYRQLQLNTAYRGLRLRRDPHFAPLWKYQTHMARGHAVYCFPSKRSSELGVPSGNNKPRNLRCGVWCL